MCYRDFLIACGGFFIGGSHQKTDLQPMVTLILGQNLTAHDLLGTEGVLTSFEY